MTYNPYNIPKQPDQYPTPEPVLYNPDDPQLPDPVDAPPPPDLVHMTPEEAWRNAARLADEQGAQ